MSVMRARMAFAMNAPALRSAAAVPAWEPITGLGSSLKAWWDAGDHGTARMTDDGAGLISSWTDKVGGLALTGTTTARPTWGAASYNSAYAGVTLDGTANQLNNATYTSLPTGATAGNIILLMSQTSGTTFLGFFFGYGSDAVGRVLYRNYISATSRLTVSNSAANLTDTIVAFNGNHIVVGEWAGTAMSGWLDGTAITPPSAVVGALATPTVGFARMGARLQANTFFAKGVIRHCFVTTQLTTLQRQQLEGWLAWDTTLTSLLPAGHPYKSVRP
jgi:hypothetical protein